MTGPVRVCVFGTFDATRHPRITTLAEGLRSHGFEVCDANVPWVAPTDERVAAVRDPRVALRLAVRLLRCWVRLAARRRQVGRVDAVLVGYLGVFDVHLARLLWPRATIVLDHLAPAGGTIDDRFAGASLRRRLAAGADRAATRRADVVLVDTDEHLKPAARGTTWLVVPVGAPRAWYAARRAADPPPPPLRVVFFGLFTPLQGGVTIAAGLARALDAGARMQVTMVGTGQEHAAARAQLGERPEVTWTNWVPSDRLPALVARHHVCLGIFGDTPKGARVVPNKVFQGAAAGCAIVTSDTPPQRRLFAEAATFVPPGDAQALTDILVVLASDHDRVTSGRREAARLADEAFTAAAVTAELAGLIGRPGKRG